MPKRYKPLLFDNNGNVLGLVDSTIDDTLGGKIWRWLHPGQERSEYEGMGQPAPEATTVFDVAETARANTAQAINTAVPALETAGKWIIVGVVAYAAIQVMRLLPKPQRK